MKIGRYFCIGIAALLGVLPAAGQKVIQRMERDVLAATKPEQRLEVGPLLGPAELQKIATFRSFGADLRSEEDGMLRRTALRLRQGDYAQARKDWESALGMMKHREFEPNLDALVHGVLKQAYIDRNSDFQPLADAVQFREEQREAAYQQRTRLEHWKANFDEGKVADGLQIRRMILPQKIAAGARPVQWSEPSVATAELVSADLEKVAVLCTAADDNAQQAVLDLQKALDGQSLQTMSNASKMLHDTAKASISNIKA